MLNQNVLERKLQISAMILIVGLVIEAICLLARGPIAFLVFVGIGGSLLLIGMVYYLLTLVSAPPITTSR